MLQLRPRSYCPRSCGGRRRSSVVLQRATAGWAGSTCVGGQVGAASCTGGFVSAKGMWSPALACRARLAAIAVGRWRRRA